jgi:protein phosphatase 2C family protein 2/3
MEDELIKGVEISQGVHLFAVLDGHAGRHTVEMVAELLPRVLKAGAAIDDEALATALEAVDRQVLAAAESGGWDDGSTALVAILTSNGARRSLRLAQLGDCQAVLCSPMTGAEALCPQHRVDNAMEYERLTAAGVRLEDGRVLGNERALAVTRAIGDLDLKRANAAGVLCMPECHSQDLSPADTLLILGCDGLWDVLNEDEAAEIAKKAGGGRNGTSDLPATARALVTAALDRKTGDNVSVLVIGLRKPSKGPQRAAAGACVAAATSTGTGTGGASPSSGAGSVPARRTVGGGAAGGGPSQTLPAKRLDVIVDESGRPQAVITLRECE